MRDFSQRGGRGDLASLLSCPAPGRPLYLEGEAADPLCNAYRPNLLLRLPPFPRLGRHPERALSREDEQPNFVELRKAEVRRIPLLGRWVNKGLGSLVCRLTPEPRDPSRNGYGQPYGYELAYSVPCPNPHQHLPKEAPRVQDAPVHVALHVTP